MCVMTVVLQRCYGTGFLLISHRLRHQSRPWRHGESLFIPNNAWDVQLIPNLSHID